MKVCSKSRKMSGHKGKCDKERDFHEFWSSSPIVKKKVSAKRAALLELEVQELEEKKIKLHTSTEDAEVSLNEILQEKSKLIKTLTRSIRS